jgi:hypothetical protein
VVAEGLAKLVMHESRWRDHPSSNRRMEESEISRVSHPPPPTGGLWAAGVMWS